MKNNKLKELLIDFIEERLQVSYERLLKQSNNKKIINKHLELFDKLSASIQNDTLLENYREAEIDAYELQIIEAYKMGFKDSINILNRY